jgi:hypothetical protein
MRTLMIGGALFVMTLALIEPAHAQLNPQQQAEAQQQAINQRRAALANCNRMHQGQVQAGVPAATATNAYNNCIKLADENYNAALQRIGFTGNTSRCTRPDGCAGPKGGFNPDPKKPPTKGCPIGGCKE